METNLEYEKNLLLSIKSDKQKFGELYKYFLNDVYRFSYSILNNKHDAEDVTSLTFIELYKIIDRFEWKEISLKSWLFKAARNICYKRIDKEKRLLNLDKPEDLEKYQEQEISFVDEIMNLELVESVKEEIQKLSPMEQELINLRVWEGFSFNEIAKIQDSTENTSIKRFSRAIQKLREAMNSKGVKSLLVLPFLFTVIKQAGFAHAYLAPVSMINQNVFNQRTIMEPTINKTNKLAAFFTSKLGIATIIAVTAIVSATGGLIFYKSNQQNQNNTRQNELTGTTTPTIEITNTPTSTPSMSITSTITPTATPSVSIAPILAKSLEKIAKDTCKDLTPNYAPQTNISNLPFKIDQNEIKFQGNLATCLSGYSNLDKVIFMIPEEIYISNDASEELGHGGAPFAGKHGEVFESGSDFELRVFGAFDDISGSIEVRVTPVVVRAIKVLTYRNGEQIYIVKDFKASESGDNRYKEIFERNYKCTNSNTLCQYNNENINKEIASQFFKDKSKMNNSERSAYNKALNFISAVDFK